MTPADDDRADALPPREPPRGKALVAASDAALRLFAFDHLATLGYRVDAVGDDEAVMRRLEKDEYDLIVTDTLTIPEGPESTRVVRVDPSVAGDREGFERAIA